MSIASYRRNVRRGVTGMYFPTCFPSALEKISPVNQFPPTIYQQYQEFNAWRWSLTGQERRKVNPAFKNIVSNMVWELGEVEFDDIEFERVDTYRAFSTVVRGLIRHNFRVAVDIGIEGEEKDVAHSVGLIPIEDHAYFRAVSNWVPLSLYGVVTLPQVYKHVHFQNEPAGKILYPFNNANIMALPAAA